MKISRRTKQLLVFFFPIVLMLSMYLVRENNYSYYEKLGLEDGIFEVIQVILYFAGTFIAGLIARHFWKNKEKFLTLIFILISLGSFLIAMEEISWGQRIFDTETDGIFEEHNVQNEINLHNLSIFYDEVRIFYILIGMYGTFSFLIYNGVNPLNDFLTKRKLHYLIVPWFLILYFLPSLVNILNTDFLAPQDLEFLELILGLGIFLFILNIFLSVRRNEEPLQDTTHTKEIK